MPGDDDTLGSQADLLRAAAAAPAVPPCPVVESGTLIAGAFRVERRLGSGGMGVVFLARDLRLGRDVAVKLHAGSDEGLLGEARVTARLTHPNIVTVYEVGTFDGRVFLAMQYLAGGTLRTWLGQRPRRWDEILDRFLEAARGLGAAHDAGLVHRDFKPENVLIGDDGRARVADFGLARAQRGDDARAAAIGSGTMPAGTPQYMSPEQKTGGAVDVRSDQYSWCVALREALSAARPPRWLTAVIARGVDDDPARRWPSMAALVERLEAGRRRRRRAVVLVATAAVVLAGAAAAWLAREDPIRTCRDQVGVAGVWDDARRASVRAALSVCEACRADDVIQTLDRYAAAWTSGRRAACVAAKLEGGKGIGQRRVDCLDEARAQLAATTALLARADAPTARLAPGAVAQLPSIDHCADVAVLGATRPPPTDPDRLAEAHSILRDLGHLAAAWRLGKVDEVLPLALITAVRARVLDYPSLTAEVLHALGMIQKQRHDPAAEATLDEAVRAALAAGHDEYAVRALVELATLLDNDGRSREAERPSRQAEAILRHMGGNDKLEGQLLGQRAHMLASLKRPAEAVAAARRSLELARRGGGDVGLATMSLGSVQERVGDMQGARQTLGEALALLDRELGGEHPMTLSAAGGLAIAEFQLGDNQGALAHLRRVVDAETRMYPALDPRRGDALNNLAAVLQATGDVEGALPLLETVLVIEEHRHAPDLAEILANLAISNGDVGRLDRGYELAVRALAEFERTRPAGSADLVTPLGIVAARARALNRLDEALRVGEKALALAERTLPADDMTLANARGELALTHLAAGRPKRAIPLLEAAIAAQTRTGLLPGNLAESRFSLARALWDSGGDRARARRLAADAHAAYDALGDQRQAAMVAAWQANHS